MSNNRLHVTNRSWNEKIDMVWKGAGYKTPIVVTEVKQKQLIEFITIKNFDVFERRVACFEKDVNGAVIDFKPSGNFDLNDDPPPITIREFNSRVEENRLATLKTSTHHRGYKMGYSVRNISIPEVTHVLLFTNENMDPAVRDLSFILIIKTVQKTANIVRLVIFGTIDSSSCYQDGRILASRLLTML